MLFRNDQAQLILSSESDHLRIYRICGDVDLDYLDEYGRILKIIPK